jgi:hypothetical protein
VLTDDFAIAKAFVQLRNCFSDGAMVPEIAALDECRLEYDWTFKQLSHAMAVADVRFSPRTLHYLIKSPHLKTKRGRSRSAVPRDRTLFKIRKFLMYAVTHKRILAAATNGGPKPGRRRSPQHHRHRVRRPRAAH